MNAATDMIFQLQREQKQHDERAHRDIYAMAVTDALRHMTFHFAKYTGRMVVARESPYLLELTTVDTLIIALASANILNLDLSKSTILFPSSSFEGDLNALCKQLAEKLNPAGRAPAEFALDELAAATGLMAKACDALDHLEEFPIRVTFRDAIEKIARLALAIAGLLSMDIVTQVRDRWTGIEKLSIFQKTAP